MKKQNPYPLLVAVACILRSTEAVVLIIYKLLFVVFNRKFVSGRVFHISISLVSKNINYCTAFCVPLLSTTLNR
jgi:hypothetical protein